MIVDDLFETFYGNGFALNQLKKTKVGINFVSRTEKNHGISGIVNPLQEIKPFEAGLITVAVGGSVLSSFIQNKPFYTGFHIMCLKPRKLMTLPEKIFYCMCIKANQFKYSWYRQANRTLKYIKLPDKLPVWVQKYKIQTTNDIAKPILERKVDLGDRKWNLFQYDFLFEIKKGERLVISKLSKKEKNGICPYVSSTAANNGISHFINVKPNHKKNTLTVSYDGSVGEVYYQSDDFWASDAVNVLYPKFSLNKFNAMFLIMLIKKERYRFNYYRKWTSEKMNKTTIKLPVDSKGDPDWKFMEDYIKSLAYSSNL